MHEPVPGATWLGWLPAGLFEAGNVQQEARWAVQVYRGVLHALPASVRIWFGDLRDKAMASAFEVSSIFLGSFGALQHVSVPLKLNRCIMLVIACDGFCLRGRWQQDTDIGDLMP